MTDIGLKQTLSSTLHYQKTLTLPMEIKELPFHTIMHHKNKTQMIQVFHVLNPFDILKHSVAYLNPSILHKTQIVTNIITKIDYTINHVIRSLTVQELNTLHIICELERSQLLTKLDKTVQMPQAGLLLTGNRSNFLYVEGSTAWLYDCPHFISLLYKANCFYIILIYSNDIFQRYSNVC